MEYSEAAVSRVPSNHGADGTTGAGGIALALGFASDSYLDELPAGGPGR